MSLWSVEAEMVSQKLFGFKFDASVSPQRSVRAETSNVFSLQCVETNKCKASDAASRVLQGPAQIKAALAVSNVKVQVEGGKEFVCQSLYPHWDQDRLMSSF